MIPKLRLSDPQSIAACELDAQQLAASEQVEAALAAGEKLSVLTGAPGAGRTRVLLHSAAKHPDSACIITPDRLRAEVLSNTAEAARLTQPRPVLSLASLAFSVLGQSAPLLEQAPPELLTGAEEDGLVRRALAEIIREGTNWPAELDTDIADIDAFVRQTRAALARAYDLRLGPEDLHAHARKAKKPLWHLIAELQERIAAAPQIPFAAMLWRAESALEALAETGRISELDGLAPLLFMDDAQDLSAGGMRFLQVLLQHGYQFVVTFQPDLATETYRDARPDMVTQWLDANKAKRIDLGASRRIGAQQLAAANAVRAHCHWLREANESLAPSWLWELQEAASAGAGEQPLEPIAASCKNEWDAVTSGQNEVALVNQPTTALVDAHCLDQLIRWGIGEGIAWEDIAILTRETQTAQHLAEVVARADIPLARRTSVLQFAENPVTATILQILLDPTDLEVLLRSPLAPVSPRWIEPILTGQVEAQADLTDSLGFAVNAESIAGYRVALRMQERAAAATGDLMTDLWSIWEAAAVADTWRDQALAGSQIHDAWLDAAVALFRHADVYAQRNPGVPTKVYCEEQLASKIAQDTIARGAPTDHGVTIGTVAQAAGRTFQRVIIVGLQEGNWPNPQVRDGIFQISSLESELTEAKQYWRSYTDTLLGELRWLLVALTRATGQTQIVYTDAADVAPSFLVKLIAQSLNLSSLPGSGESSAAQTAQMLPAQFTQNGLRGVIATLRGALIDPQEIARRASTGEIPGTETEILNASATLLAYLAKAGVNGADPRFWTGIAQAEKQQTVLDSSTIPAWQSGAHLSPSAVERMLQCPMRWALERFGGQNAPTTAIDIGIFIHALAEEFSDTQLSEQELIEEFTARAENEFDFGEELTQRRDQAYLATCVKGLAKYLVAARAPEETGKRRVAGVEVEVKQKFSDILVRGKIDRIEEIGDPDANVPTVEIVDFKTGKTVPSAARAQENPQLAIYQWLAAQALGYRPQGAKLVYVGVERKSSPGSAVCVQDGSAREQAEELLQEAVHVLHGAKFAAVVNDQCDNCAFKSLCPNFYKRTLP